MTEEDVVDVEAVEEETQNLPAVRASEAIVARDEITVAEVVAQHDKVMAVMEAVMTEGIHYGKIPGISKPTLLKPGAESINVALRLAPDYESDKVFTDDGHLTVTSKCTLRHITTGLVIASGEGMCSSREVKYAYRKEDRKCPTCGAEAIIKGKAEYGGGWLCWKKRDGCGAKFDDGDSAIEDQTVGRIDNPDLPDTWNTVLKMADKRALIAAVLNGTAASDVFTQDVEDQKTTASDSDDGPYGPHAPEVRVEGPAPLRPPNSWAKITEYVSAYDQETYTVFNTFADAARRRLFPGSTDTKGLAKEERDQLFQVTARAAFELRKAVDASKFPPPALEDLRRAWTIAMDGEELSIGEEHEAGEPGDDEPLNP